MGLPVSDLVAKARRFATEAHARIDQRRKYTRQPYQVHLKSVGELVTNVTADPEMIAAAWLHDTVEDTPATFGDLEREFGPEVTRLVADLTDVSKASDGNRAARKAIDRLHTAQASPRAKTVKLADLIDNCRDICRHDPAFARVYLGEATALLEILMEGDATLYQRAQQAVADCARHLGLPRPAQTLSVAEEGPTPTELSLSQRRVQRLFTDAFTARDIAEPLRSFDLELPAVRVNEAFKALGLEVAGLRREGRVVGYVEEKLAEARGQESHRPLTPGQVVPGDAPLSDVIGILTRYDFCFVTAMGDVAGVITRTDIQKPIVRMWLFGIVTLTEIDLMERIRALWPDGSWTRLVSAGRLDKAQALLLERRRRGQHVELLDCLQLSDKAQILMDDEGQRSEFGFATKGAAKRVIQDLESLRNNLAHAQDIVTHDWPQIARLARRIEDRFAGWA
jgi:hypothetical protein